MNFVGVREEDIESEPLFVAAAAKKIYPQSVRGTYRSIKWALLIVALGVYYLLPFVRWDRGPNEPAQAVLVDLAHRRFYFFFIEIWPQEVYYFTGLLILAAMVLFLMNAVAGRVWCGYLCPQTVWTDLFFAVERLIEGDRRERIQNDSGPWTLSRIWRRTLKHLIWLLIAWWTGGAWVLYFADAPSLVVALATFHAPIIAYVWIGILTFTTYTFAGHMREAVCLYMCPWPRIQAALTDDDALNVTYRYDRGEPRVSIKKAATLRLKGEAAGDCVDCNQCVAVCPTGVDIRNGSSLGCIQCGLCIDACDAIMQKVGRPPRLIAYDTDVNIKRRLAGQSNVFRLLRARTLLYVGIIAIVGGLMLFALTTRTYLGLAAIHDRNPLVVNLADGSIRNAYTIRIVNRGPAAHSYELKVEPFPASSISAVGVEKNAAGWPSLQVGPDQTAEVRVFISLPAAAVSAASQDVTFRILDETSHETAAARDHFLTH
jgi:cytochrome c oxidase accessory protein FixG